MRTQEQVRTLRDYGNTLNNVAATGGLNAYKITLADYNVLMGVYHDLVWSGSAEFISTGVYLFLKRYTKIEITQRGIGWIARI